MEFGKHHKILGVAAMVGVFVAGLMGVLSNKHAGAVTDICTGVNTTFTATAPKTVVAGKSFSVGPITIKPDASYGFNVTSSTLKMSSTNASPASYSKNNTSTDPSPTTGAPTYTAYFPKWSLVADNAVGSTITIKLVSATAVVETIETPITCQLTATLATIKIVAASSSGSSSSSGGSTNSDTSTSSETAKPEDAKPESEATTGDTQASEQQTAISQESSQSDSSDVAGSQDSQKKKLFIIVPLAVLSVAAIAGAIVFVLRKRQLAAKAVTGSPITPEVPATAVLPPSPDAVVTPPPTPTAAPPEPPLPPSQPPEADIPTNPPNPPQN